MEQKEDKVEEVKYKSAYLVVKHLRSEKEWSTKAHLNPSEEDIDYMKVLAHTLLTGETPAEVGEDGETIVIPAKRYSVAEMGTLDDKKQKEIVFIPTDVMKNECMIELKIEK